MTPPNDQSAVHFGIGRAVRIWTLVCGVAIVAAIALEPVGWDDLMAALPIGAPPGPGTHDSDRGLGGAGGPPVRDQRRTVVMDVGIPLATLPTNRASRRELKLGLLSNCHTFDDTFDKPVDVIVFKLRAEDGSMVDMELTPTDCQRG